MFSYFFESLSLHTAHEQRQNYENSTHSTRALEKEELSVSVALGGSSFRRQCAGAGNGHERLLWQQRKPPPPKEGRPGAGWCLLNGEQDHEIFVPFSYFFRLAAL